ncbi:ATP-binding cassette domain-containing protein [Streptomyces sp. NPDC050523]|uniref:ATP-binding cassette domain-containing protein n=1 Tax=Streptomyces sp. NPDC050523 TaxID=3365622 RepID=UPI00378D107B
MSLRITPGETYGLPGPDGAGRTTTTRMVCGLLRPDAVCVRVADRPHARGRRDDRVLPAGPAAVRADRGHRRAGLRRGLGRPPGRGRPGHRVGAGRHGAGVLAGAVFRTPKHVHAVGPAV